MLVSGFGGSDTVGCPHSFSILFKSLKIAARSCPDSTAWASRAFRTGELHCARAGLGLSARFSSRIRLTRYWFRVERAGAVWNPDASAVARCLASIPRPGGSTGGRRMGPATRYPWSVPGLRAGWTIVSYPCGNRLPGRCEHGVSRFLAENNSSLAPLSPGSHVQVPLKQLAFVSDGSDDDIAHRIDRKDEQNAAVAPPRHRRLTACST